MSCTGTTSCTCGCCSGTSVQTPQQRDNLPGLAEVSYRVGSWSSFNESLLARLSSSDYPALASLKTRDSDDFTIALLDASAIVLDVLTFYQERLANEGYLRTAQQTRSLTELSRLIGYQPSPGVSASTYAAFTLKAAPGQPPDPTAATITIPQGTQVQSVPPQGQAAQTFETAADIAAKVDWSALPVQTAAPWVAPGNLSTSGTPGPGGVYLSGTTTQLQVGDSLLILSVGRETWTPSPTQLSPVGQWGVVVLTKVVSDTARQLTYVGWDEPLDVALGFSETIWSVPEITYVNRYGQRYSRILRHLVGMKSVPDSAFASSTWTSAKVFAFRQKACLFGYNAPDPNLFVDSTTKGPATNGLIRGSPPTTSGNTTTTTPFTWANFNITSATQIDLDATYPKVVAGSWFTLVVNGTVQLYKVASAQTVSRSAFALSGKITRLAPDYQDPLLPVTPPVFPLQGTEVWMQSDQLTVAEQPLPYPLYGAVVDLQNLRPDLVGLQVVAVSGKRQKLAVASGTTGLFFIPDDGTAAVLMNPGDVFTLTDPTPLIGGAPLSDWRQATALLILSLQDSNGRTGISQASLSQFVLVPSGAGDPFVSEYALVSVVEGTPVPYAHTQIQLQGALVNCYERASTTINANVALVTHGQSVTEIMGSGNASTPDQGFTLKQSPLTYVQAPTPTGRQSTLQVQVNGAAWTEVDSLYGTTSSQQVFDVLNQSDGTADVQFGDGSEGALLPTGQNNLIANYRIGLGSAGNIAANTLTTLIDRPLGVSAVTNPGPATGGQDPQSIEDIRTNAPLSVLTLGRAVSVSDYENYAASFAGIAKAHALWIPSGPNRGVFLTVAGVGGAALPPANPTLNNLLTSLQDYGNPLIPITAQSFVETLFGFSADLQYDPAYQQSAVTAQVLQTLSTTFGFAQRGFGQGVSLDEIATVIQNVPGVVGVNVYSLTVIASSTAGDLASSATGFSVSSWNNWIAQQIFVPRPPAPANGIAAFLPTANTQFLPLPAEILVLDPDPSSVVLGVMS